MGAHARARASARAWFVRAHLCARAMLTRYAVRHSRWPSERACPVVSRIPPAAEAAAWTLRWPSGRADHALAIAARSHAGRRSWERRNLQLAAMRIHCHEEACCRIAEGTQTLSCLQRNLTKGRKHFHTFIVAFKG